MPATNRMLHAINNNGMAPVILSPKNNVYSMTQQDRGGMVLAMWSTDEECSELLLRRC